MRLSAKEFYNWEHKAISLLGMSGVGKTRLASKLPSNNWFHYSGDYRIGTQYLQEPILDNIKKQAMQVDFLRDLLRSDSIYIASNITIDNLDLISTFLGKLGNPALGGMLRDEFKRRQNLHRKAEISAMRDVREFIGKAKNIYGYPHFINDAGGSICELNDSATLELLAQHTLIIYIRAPFAMEEDLIQRAIASPKPMYYQDSFLDEHIREYLIEQKMSGVKDIDPDHFVTWIFPKLFSHRKPLYQDIVDQYGYSVCASEMSEVGSESEFVDLVASIL